MILSMSGQAWLFLSTVVVGFIIGFVYDIFRIIRKTIPHRTWVVQVEDVLYWSSVSILMFYFMLQRNYGEIRFFSIAGAAIGMVIYFCSASILVMKVSVAVIEFFKRVILTALRILLTPIRWLIKLLAPPGKKIYQSTRSKVRYLKRGSYTKLRKTRKNMLIILKKV